MQIELSEVRAMLQEICVATFRGSRASQEVMKIGTGKTNWSELENISELADIVLATRKAVQATKGGKITIEQPAWQKLEDVYYQRVVKPIFAD